MYVYIFFYFGNIICVVLKWGYLVKDFGFVMVLLRCERVCYIFLVKILKFNIKENEDVVWNLGIILLLIDKCLYMIYNCILLVCK